jgi:hypothetical protein
MKIELKAKIENLTNSIKKAIMKCNKLSMTKEQFVEFEQIFKSYEIGYDIYAQLCDYYNPYNLNYLKITLSNNYIIYFTCIKNKINLWVNEDIRTLLLIDNSIPYKYNYINENNYFKKLFNIKELNLIDIFKCIDYFGDYLVNIRNILYELCKYKLDNKEGYNITYDSDACEELTKTYNDEIFEIIKDIKINKMNEYKKNEFLKNFFYDNYQRITINKDNNVETCTYFVSSRNGIFTFYYCENISYKYLNKYIEIYRKTYPNHKFLFGGDIIESILI